MARGGDQRWDLGRIPSWPQPESTATVSATSVLARPQTQMEPQPTVTLTCLLKLMQIRHAICRSLDSWVTWGHPNTAGDGVGGSRAHPARGP